MLSVIVGRNLPDLAQSLEQFTRRCGGLPLAMEVAAAYLRTRPTWALADLNDRLVTAQKRSAADHLNSRTYAAFAVSLYALPEEQRTVLCLLAAHPGPDIGTDAVSALTGTDPATADLALEALLEYHLIEETRPHRYRLHDLMREYALTELALRQGPADTDAALSRLLSFYLATALSADRAIHPRRRPAAESPAVARTTPTFDSPGRARAWLDTEWQNLDAMNLLAHQRGWHDRARLLPLVLAEFLDRRGDWTRAIGILQQAMESHANAGKGFGDATAARLLTDLAAARIRTGELDLALSLAQRALNAWVECGDRYGQANAWVQIGRTHFHARQPALAIPAYEQAAALYDSLGDLGRRAVAEDHLSVQMFELGRHAEAFTLSHRALETARDIGDPALQCDVHTNLGEMYRRAGHVDKALWHLHQAEAFIDDLGDPQNTAVLHSNIGAVHSDLGEHEAAQASFHTALTLFQALGDHRNEIDTLISLAGTDINRGDHGAAFQHLHHASHLAASIHDPLRRARIHLTTGHAHRGRRQLPEALNSYHASVAEALTAEAPLDQAHALRAIGEVLDLREDPDAAAFAQRANTIYQQLRHPAAMPDETAP
ncbi:tetratricopeptide repeat protein [Catenulispora yoronensis]